MLRKIGDSNSSSIGTSTPVISKSEIQPHKVKIRGRGRRMWDNIWTWGGLHLKSGVDNIGSN